MRIIPILFSTPMVQAILSGNKSMTRRTMKLQPGEGERYEAMGENEFAYISKGGISGPYKCPYGQPGDVLWVRETFMRTKYTIVDEWFTLYKADATEAQVKAGEGMYLKWKPNIHMPFAACRIFLRVKEIRVERLHDISEEDCVKEGIDTYADCLAQADFAALWRKINGADSWNSNPWVWVIAFERINAENEIADIRKQWNERRAK